MTIKEIAALIERKIEIICSDGNADRHRIARELAQEIIAAQQERNPQFWLCDCGFMIDLSFQQQKPVEPSKNK